MPTGFQALVYTRTGCHLCEEACELLAKHGFSVEKVDIDDDPQLQVRYSTCVPVVLIGGRERFRGKVNEVLLERLIHGMS